MTEENQPYEVVISDDAWAHIRELPPEAVDSLAQTLAVLRKDPSNTPGLIAETPIPVDHSEGRERTYVPATRSIGYLRNAVAEISPETVKHFDTELSEATRHTEEGGVDGQLRGLRAFVMRWVDYIAIQGDHDTARHIAAAPDADEMGARYAAAMRTAHREYFPDAEGAHGHDLSVKVRPAGGRWIAVCPVTQLRADGPTEQAATGKLRALLMEWITG